MFMGTYNNSIDGKNRIVVPSKFREQLGNEGCVVTIGIEGCLNIYSEEAWKSYAKKMEEIPESAIKAKRIVRSIFSNATECKFDKQGKILIPEHLREYAGITKELVTIGVMTNIEIWAKEKWHAADNTGKISPEEYAEALRECGM